MSYKDLEIYTDSVKLAVEIHKISFILPKYELYEEGSQIRRACKSIPSNIAEGYGRRRYKQDYIKFLIYAQASCDEVRVHLELLFKTNSLAKEQFTYFDKNYEILGKKIGKYIQYVKTSWRT